MVDDKGLNLVTNSLSVYFPVVCQQGLVYRECWGILIVQGK